LAGPAPRRVGADTALSSSGEGDAAGGEPASPPLSWYPSGDGGLAAMSPASCSGPGGPADTVVVADREGWSGPGGDCAPGTPRSLGRFSSGPGGPPTAAARCCPPGTYSSGPGGAAPNAAPVTDTTGERPLVAPSSVSTRPILMVISGYMCLSTSTSPWARRAQFK
jgi:hypothetical protein